MWDKLDLRIPFHEFHVSETSLTNDQRTGSVDIRDYDFPADCPVMFVEGERVYSDPKARKWETISSSISSVAVGFHPEGNGFYPWPHVSIKASPNKILQGHNVFGSENIRPGLYQMLASLQMAFPKIYQHLDIENSEVRYLDSTYSAFVPSTYQRNQLINLVEAVFPNKEMISRHVGYVQANRCSEYFRQKVYYKEQELLADLDTCKRQRNQSRVDILSDKRLQDFAYGRLRLEATSGHRGLDRLGIPRRLPEFLRFHDWFQSVHKEPLCQYLWSTAFKKVFSQIEGHTMKNVDDEKIKLEIESRFITVSASGRLNRRKANAIYQTYRNIKSEGYDQLAKEKSSTFYRNVKCLEEIGLSRGFLKSLDPRRPHDNVVPMVQLIRVDFTNQRPDWYVEPESGFDDKRRHLRLVA
ncbi:phage/plasmid replication protein, II/X family [uncultured Porticoccus sp.]|uniref:phage/plasmid replication protein, II/X family n=1 Tax=uncultured Porticoccus sp. TaxID=1256050 RepID=UPI00261A76F8|nr:phage/plasmid replication protein, II/X family [uncultured Porticoccus sp.]